MNVNEWLSFFVVGRRAMVVGSSLRTLLKAKAANPEEGKKLLVRIVAMLTRMTIRGGQVRQENLVYGNVYEEETGQPEAGGDA